jgi:HD-GYP domain-containing protein (c-di-GMP phosphodiesterase class II)
MVEGDGLRTIVEVIKRVDAARDLSAQINGILEWVSAALGADGAALLDAGPNAEKPGILAALGALSHLQDDGFVKLRTEDLPLGQPAIIPIAGEDGNTAETYFHPVWVDQGAVSVGLLFQAEGIAKSANIHRDELAVASFLLHGIRERTLLQEQLDRDKAFIGLLVEKKVGSGPETVNPGFDLITEGLDLPLYMCNTAGALIYASPAFLRLTGYRSVEEIRKHPDFYLDPQSRAAEINALRSHGKVSVFSLGVSAGDGRRLEIQDSAVTVGAFVFGVFFDVTGFLAANKELKDTLEVQELLSDRFIAATQVLQRTQATSIRALARLAEFRDQETGFHLQRMCEYTRMIAQQVFEKRPYSFHLSAAYPTDISLSSMLHDIGKVSIPDNILLKQGRLDAEEWEIMKTHTTAGWEILHHADKELGEQSFLTLASTIALSHHERYDGMGYPAGLAEEKIPLSARISALADVYDALTTKRPYKEAWDHEKACEEIAANSGARFDPVIVDIFESMAEEFDGIRRVFPG